MGKVYCKVDARQSSIEIGDLLTTSSTKGYAMKAEDPMKAFGAVIGKALGSIKQGLGMIPVLVALTIRNVKISVRESISKVIESPWRFVKLRSLAIFFRLRQSPLSLKDIISKCDEPGIAHRTAFLEIDMMQGTAFPPDQLLFEDRLHTLQDIYLQAGIILDVRLDENNIPDLVRSR